MVLPIVLGALALGAGAFGVSKGVEGANSIASAEDRRKKATAKFEAKKRRLKSRADYVNTEAEMYGLKQKVVKEKVFTRTASLIEAIGKRANVKIYDLLDGVDIHIPSVSTEEGHQVNAESVLKGLLTAAGASAVSSAAATSAVTGFATASTGAAISGLSGAAANSAMLAALGGGSLAAGGGGMALGTVVLGGLTVAPAIAVGGIAIACEGEKAMTKAVECEAQVEEAVSLMKAKEGLLDRLVMRLDELGSVLDRLTAKSLDLLASLEVAVDRQEFDELNDCHMESLRALLLIVGSLAQIMRAPIIGEDGELNPELEIIIKKVTV